MGTNIPHHVVERYESISLQDENLLWAGQSAPGQQFRIIRAVAIVGLAVSLFFVVMFMILAIRDPKAGWLEYLVVLLGLPAFGFLVSMLIARGLCGEARRVWYLVTDRRVILMWGKRSSLAARMGAPEFVCYMKPAVHFLHVAHGRNGIGHLVFGSGLGHGNGSLMPLQAIFAIERPQEVKDLMRKHGYAPFALATPPFVIQAACRLFL